MTVNKDYPDNTDAQAMQDAAEDEQAETKAPPVKAWVMAYVELGLLSAVADSQERLVERINDARLTAGMFEKADGHSQLIPFDVLSNNWEDPTVATVWLNPLLILGVLEQFVPRTGSRGAPSGPSGMPAGLLELLAGAGLPKDKPKPAPDPDEAVVLVVEEQKRLPSTGALASLVVGSPKKEKAND